MKIRIAKIHEAAPSRPPGYVEVVLSRGVVDGEWLEIDVNALAELRDRFRPKTTPPVSVLAANLARAAVGEVKARVAGLPKLTAEEIERRMATCRRCENFIHGQSRCALCGCFAALKSRMRSQHCPVGKW
jgi:hypothetical protein